MTGRAHAPTWCGARYDQAEAGIAYYVARSPELVTCEQCKPRAARAFAAKRRAYIRTPPRPPFDKAANGLCRVCGEPTEGKRFRWHQHCADLWNLASGSYAHAAAHLRGIEGGRCFACGVQEMVVDDDLPRYTMLYVDHVRPLWSLSEAERAQLRWWLPGNLQLLCKRCHDAKTAAEARLRSVLKRGGKSGTPVLALPVFRPSWAVPKPEAALVLAAL